MESPGRPNLRCLSCSAVLGETFYRCRDCAVGAVWCPTCVVSDHRVLFLHRVEVMSIQSFAQHDLTGFDRSGTAHFLRRPPSRRLACVFNLATYLARFVPVLRSQPTTTSSSSTLMGSTRLRSTFVGASIQLRQSYSYSALDFSPLRPSSPRRRLPFAFWRHFKCFPTRRRYRGTNS